MKKHAVTFTSNYVKDMQSNREQWNNTKTNFEKLETINLKKTNLLKIMYK